MDLNELAQLLGAGGVGGIVTQYISRGVERRQARGSVREALSEVERLRWTFDLKDNEVREFRRALRSFASAALVAGMPRRLVDRYEHMAQVSRFATRLKLEGQNVTSADHMTLDVEFEQCVEKAHQLVADYLWRPTLARLLLRHELQSLDKLEEAATQTQDGRALRYQYPPS